MTGKQLEELIKEIERKAGKYVAMRRFDENGITDVEFANIGPYDDYVINVWNCRAELCRQAEDWHFSSVDGLIPDSLREEYEAWLVANIDAQGGTISTSGIYRVVLGMPKPIADVLGIVPEAVILDEEDD